MISSPCLHQRTETVSSTKGQSKLRLYNVQQIGNAHSDSIWVAKFSHCGRYLATGGKDACLKVWRVNTVQHDAETEESKGFRRTNTRTPTPDLSLFESSPAWEFREHAQDILDVSWRDTRHEKQEKV